IPKPNIPKVYNLLFRRTSSFTLTIVVGAVIFERAMDQGAEALYEYLNQGVSRWKKWYLNAIKTNLALYIY
uniref:Complex III subunit 9 n=1 Tax=Varanus komodoensis TaxID=61221 RepID=A0A8D2JL58_VARKO